MSLPSWADVDEEEREKENAKLKEMEENYEKIVRISVSINHSGKIKLVNPSPYRGVFFFGIGDEDFSNLENKGAGIRRNKEGKITRYLRFPGNNEATDINTYTEISSDGVVWRKGDRQNVNLKSIKLDIEDEEFRHFYTQKLIEKHGYRRYDDMMERKQFNEDVRLNQDGYNQIEDRTNTNTNPGNINNNVWVNRNNNNNNEQMMMRLKSLSSAKNEIIKMKIKEMMTFCFEREINLEVNHTSEGVTLKITY